MARRLSFTTLFAVAVYLSAGCAGVPPGDETASLPLPTPPWVGLGQPGTGSVWLLVTNAEGQRVDQVAPYIRRDGSISIELLDDARPGEMAIHNLEPGVWVVGVQGHGYLLEEVTFQIHADHVSEGHVVVDPDPAPPPPVLVVHETGLPENGAMDVAEAVNEPSETVITVAGYIFDREASGAPYMCDGGLPSWPPGCADPFYLVLQGFEWTNIAPETAGGDRWAYGVVRGEIRQPQP